MEEKAISLNCELHKNGRTLYFCQSLKCGKLICEECLPSHSKHNYVHLLELGNEMKAIQNEFWKTENEKLVSAMKAQNSLIRRMDIFFTNSEEIVDNMKNKLKIALAPFSENGIASKENIRDAIATENIGRLGKIHKQVYAYKQIRDKIEAEAERVLRPMDCLDELHDDIKQRIREGNELLLGIDTQIEIKCIMFGLDAAGKTTILYRLKLDEFITTIPTIGIYIYIYYILGFNVEEIQYQNIKMTIWDLGGAGKIRLLWAHYYPSTNLIIFVIDASDLERIDDVKLEMDTRINHEELIGVPILFLLNKSELPNALTVAEAVEKLNISLLRRPWYITAINAFGDINEIFKSFDWVVKHFTH